MSRLVVLYEDKLGEPKPANYGPHILALACAADLLGHPGTQRQLAERVDAIPTKGVDALIRKHLPGISARVEWLALCADDDQIRPHVGLSQSACKTTVRDSIRAFAPSAQKPVGIVLLQENMESVHSACCRAMGQAAPTKKPRPLDRDQTLHTVAASAPALRTAVMTNVPTWHRLAVLLALWCGWVP